MSPPRWWLPVPVPGSRPSYRRRPVRRGPGRPSPAEPDRLDPAGLRAVPGHQPRGGRLRDPGSHRSRRLATAGLPMAWLASWTWPLSLLLPMLVLPALYPTGRPSRYWRWHVRACWWVSSWARWPWRPAPVARRHRRRNTAAVDGAGVDGTRWVSAAALLIAAAASSIVGTFVRAWRATAPERQQLSGSSAWSRSWSPRRSTPRSSCSCSPTR